MGRRQCAVPEFGGVILRDRLLRTFQLQAPGITVLCAPAGFGKSVLASQLARLQSFDQAVWVSVHDVDVSGHGAVEQLCAAFLRTEDRACGAQREGTPPAPLSLTDSMMSIRECLGEYAGDAVCVVIDGANHLYDAEPICELGRVIRSCTSARSQLIVTCRRLGSMVPPDPSGIWVLEPPDLRFSMTEVEQLVRECAAPSSEQSDASAIFERFGGQPALTNMMLRHSEVCSDNRPSQDLVWHAQRVVTSAPPELLPGLYGAVVMQEGRVGHLRAILEPLGERLYWSELVELTPLFSASEPCGRSTFRVHAALGEAVRRVVGSCIDADVAEAIRKRVFEHLAHVGKPALLLSAVETNGHQQDIQKWLEDSGAVMLWSVGPAAVEQCLERIPSAVIAGSWRLLLLRAAILRQQEDSGEAMRHALLAKSLAELEGSWSGRVDSSLLIARLALDNDEFSKTRSVLAPLDSADSSRLSTEARCLVESYLAGAESQMGLIGSARERVVRTRELLETIDCGTEAAVYAANAAASVEGMVEGLWTDVVVALSRVMMARGVAPLQRLAIRSNYASAVFEAGRVSEALDTALDVLRETELNGLQRQRTYALGTYAAASCVLGDIDQCRASFAECDKLHERANDIWGRATERANAACCLRAAGFAVEALALCDVSSILAGERSAEFVLLSVFIRTESAASVLATGDSIKAVRLATDIRREIEGVPAHMHLLRLDLILAEAERRAGRFTVATERVRLHSAYILTDSANAMLSLYVRAFPGLLGVLCAALGVAEVPLRMLRLLPSSTVDLALAAMDDFVPLDVKDTLLQRITGHQPAVPPSPSKPPETEPTWPCRVRLLGGLEVTTEFGLVDDSHWRKRKSRLVFAMLAVRQGQDIARDVIIERLWPHMDEESARRNFYVTWSTMKKALACGGPPALGGAYVCTTGNACRLSRAVRSDLDDFAEVVGRMRRAKGATDAGEIIELARRLADIYRGDLLPGDIYEEWFAECREQLRQDFGDAMVQAALAAEVSGDPSTALLFLRRVANVDPWREDVYQGAMRCQIIAGQRSRAIETYMSCRSRLVEDLGIDPSPETARLYHTILAMEEDGPEPPPPADSTEETDEEPGDE